MSEHEQEIVGGDPETVKHESARRTRRSFLVGGVAAAAAYGAVQWINEGEEIGRQPEALRRTLQADAAISRGVFEERGLAPTYPLSRARPLRLNGNVGLDQKLVLPSWRLQLAGVANAAASPHFAKDVTAWNYQYTGDQPQTAQSDDVKSAPGNQAGRNGDKSGGDKSKTGAETKSGAPKAQEPASSAKGGSHRDKQEPGAGAGSGQPAETGATASATAGGGKLSMAERFNAMNRAIHRKRHLGDEEAGPSASSLDIGTPGLLLSLDDLRQLPRVELVTQFKCIEGWSEIVQWAGVRLRDLIDAFPPEKVNGREPRYVYMETPDGNYYGGYDMSAARHPQSLLVTDMGGQPLTQDHGAPLRLHMPIKYGYKQLKRIGLIAYTDTRPDDYWTKLGYDWYAGL